VGNECALPLHAGKILIVTLALGNIIDPSVTYFVNSH
jgi:hypothetical protein